MLETLYHIYRRRPEGPKFLCTVRTTGDKLQEVSQIALSFGFEMLAIAAADYPQHECTYAISAVNKDGDVLRFLGCIPALNEQEALKQAQQQFAGRLVTGHEFLTRQSIYLAEKKPNVEFITSPPDIDE
jgi:hypothetical protein